jgi:hypothetical protein
MCVLPEHQRYVTKSTLYRPRGPLHSIACRAAARRRAKLTLEQVREIRRGWERGESGLALAAAYGVSTSLVSYIVRGERWKETSPWAL